MKFILPKQLKNFPHNLSKFNTGLFWVFATWGIYFLWLWPRMFYYKEQSIWAGFITVWADWAAHVSYAAPFAYKDPGQWFVAHPLFINKPYIYPFVPDAISGLLIRFGLNTVNSFVLPSILFTFMLLYACTKILYTQLKSVKQSYVGLTVFLLSGGLGFLWFLKDLKLNGISAIIFPPQTYTSIIESNVAWINLIWAQILPQRSFLMGFPLALLVIIFTLTNQNKKLDTKLAIKILLYGIIAGLLPIIHFHSFLALIIVLGTFGITNLRSYKFYTLLAIVSALVSSIVWFVFYKQGITESPIRIYIGWMSKSLEINFIYFWILNWGIFLPLALAGTFINKLYKSQIVISGYVIFIICNLVLFQSYDWDNSKILIYAYLFLSIPVVKFLAYLYKKNILFKTTAVIFFTVLIFSGLLDTYRLYNKKELAHELYSKDQLYVAQQINSYIKSGDVVLTATNHNNLVSGFTKGQILMGYNGWMWSYGFDYLPVEQDIDNFFTNPSKDVVKKYKVKYILYGPSEREIAPSSEYLLENQFSLVFKYKEYAFYKAD